tara:strand:- start:493 stop:900 length:408 start_codon:yes stop_codon:yes gene_type:complete
MSDTSEQDIKYVDEATFTNTPSGGTELVHHDNGTMTSKFVAKRVDGKIVYTSNLKVSTNQMDRQFKMELTAKTLKAIVIASEKSDQPLKVVEGVDYRLNGEPRRNEADPSKDREGFQQAYYQPKPEPRKPIRIKY